MPSKVIVNADDFGLCAATNAVIVRGFDAGLLSSATIMANMPAFAEACALSQRPALRGRVGLHFNLSHGRPLSQAILAEPRLCDGSGHFAFGLRRDCLRLRPSERAAVRAELEAQWAHCLAHGVRPSHVDSHQHVHNLWPIGGLLARFAAEQRVPVRLARNLGRNIGPLKRLFKTALNARLRQLCAVTADHVCTPADLKAGLAPALGLLEVVVHPNVLGDDDFGDAYLPQGESLSALLEQWLSGVPRVGYATD